MGDVVGISYAVVLKLQSKLADLENRLADMEYLLSLSDEELELELYGEE